MNNELKWVWQEVVVTQFHILPLPGICLVKGSEENHRTLVSVAGYTNIGFYDTLSIASNIQWYELIPHKATVFIPCLVRHAQMHQPRM
jgi:hypothetical protein